MIEGEYKNTEESVTAAAVCFGWVVIMIVASYVTYAVWSVL